MKPPLPDPAFNRRCSLLASDVSSFSPVELSVTVQVLSGSIILLDLYLRPLRQDTIGRPVIDG